MTTEANTDETADAQNLGASHAIRNSIVSDVAWEYGVDESTVDEILALSNADWTEYAGDLRAGSDVIHDSDELLIALVDLDSLAIQGGEIVDEIGANLVADDVARIIQTAHNRQAVEFESIKFGGRQSAVTATSASEAVIVDLDS